MYLAAGSRPEIAFAVNHVSRAVEAHKQSDFVVVKRI